MCIFHIHHMWRLAIGDCDIMRCARDDANGRNSQQRKWNFIHVFIFVLLNLAHICVMSSLIAIARHIRKNMTLERLWTRCACLEFKFDYRESGITSWKSWQPSNKFRIYTSLKSVKPWCDDCKSDCFIGIFILVGHLMYDGFMVYDGPVHTKLVKYLVNFYLYYVNFSHFVLNLFEHFGSFLQRMEVT